MTLKTVKGIDDETWKELKALAAREGVNIGDVIETMVKDYSKYRKDFWKKVLEEKRILSDKEADDMEKAIASLRKERGFR